MLELYRFQSKFKSIWTVGIAMLVGCASSSNSSQVETADSKTLPKPIEILRGFVSLTISEANESTPWRSLPPELVNKLLSHLSHSDVDREASLMSNEELRQAVPPEYEILLICRDFTSLQILSDDSLTDHYLSGSSKWYAGEILTIEDRTFGEQFRVFVTNQVKE